MVLSLKELEVLSYLDPMISSKHNIIIHAISSKLQSSIQTVFLNQLRRSGASREDLLCFCGTVLRPVLKYASPV